jgi:hypothetical protein
MSVRDLWVALPDDQVGDHPWIDVGLEGMLGRDPDQGVPGLVQGGVLKVVPRPILGSKLSGWQGRLLEQGLTSQGQILS